jgi:anti-sigma-K factor RskA
MQALVRKDAPWVFGFNPKNFSLFHHWYKNVKPNLMANNRLKYTRIEDKERTEKRELWNHAVFWPLVLALISFILLLVPAVNAFKRRLKETVQ